MPDVKMEWPSRNVFLFLYIFVASTSLHDAMNISTQPGGPGDYMSPSFAQQQALGGLPSSAVNPSALPPQQSYVSPVTYDQSSYFDSSQYPVSNVSTMGVSQQAYKPLQYSESYMSPQVFDQSSNVPIAYPVRNYPHDPRLGANYTESDLKINKKMEKKERKEIKERQKLIEKEEKHMYKVPKEKGHNKNKEKKKKHDKQYNGGGYYVEQPGY